jgi:hypothetical protein
LLFVKGLWFIISLGSKTNRGLSAENLLIQLGIKKARILSAEPLETTQDIPLNNVPVIDNSFSMEERRAKAAYEEILAGGVPEGETIRYAGAGPHDPLFDNNLPEGRALNRTVTVTLE